MAPSSMEIKVISCKDLKAFNFFQKLSIYAVVSIVSDDPDKKQKKQHLLQKTPIDKEGDGNPEWKHELQFDFKDISSVDQDQDQFFLVFDLRCEGIVFGDKTIGEVRVPFKVLLQEFNGAVRFVSYQVRTTDGKPNGVLNFSYKVIDNKIGKTESPIDNSGFHAIYPSLDNLYPLPEIHFPTPAIQHPSPEVYYPSPEVYYPPEVYYMAPPPPPPPPNTLYYPPLPPPPAIYPTQPAPYGYESGSYIYPIHPYYTPGQLQQADDDTWQKGSQQRGGGGIAGSWNFR